ncbi:MAG TPA: NPCBM/NEW2 domain-containing protein, partial [Candidatus Cybelea sp.]|nr:NPCBM/NEW2 domain-containing protein [Candidatus Cybelea sp.]
WRGNDDHGARTFPCVVKEGAFRLGLAGLPAGKERRLHLVLSPLHVNGAAERVEIPLAYDGTSAPDVASLNGDLMVSWAENAVMRGRDDARNLVSDTAVAAAPTPEAARKLRLLRSVLEPVAPFDLGTVAGDSAILSDAKWTEATVGWGQVARNHFWFDEHIQDGVFLSIKDRFYDKGLYAHSPARYAFPLDGKWKTFTASIGLRDGANLQGSAVFTVRGDGRELYRSRMLRVGERDEVKVDIAGVKELELVTAGGEGHNHNSWAIWAEPEVKR